MLFTGRLSLALGSIAAICALPAVAEDRSPLDLKPMSDWTLTERADSCVMSRQFAQGDAEVLLQLENYTLGDGFRTYVVTGDLEPRKALPQVAFLPGGEPTDASSAVQIKLKDGRTALVFNASVLTGMPSQADEREGAKSLVPLPPTPQEDFELREKAVDHLFVGEGFDRDLILRTGSMRPAMVVMRSCTGPLARKLGLDPVAMKNLSRSASPKDPKKWARSVQSDYPSQMVANGINSQLTMRIIVDALGNVTACSALPEGQPAPFEQTACRHTMKVKFDPALDASGNPVASIYSTLITYRVN